jgi:hypothetical protein
MQFLAPLFLLALAGLAIPVLLHLTQREKKQVVRFPSLMFVRRIPYQSVRRRKIHNWLLLAVRMTALALIVLAFARPLVTRADAVLLPGEGGREVVILLDTSYSMGYADRWDRALEAVTDVVRGLTSADRASLVAFSSNAEILLRSTAERDRITAAASTRRPEAGATRYAPALKVAGGILDDSTLPLGEVVLVSDFQRSGWRGEEGSRLPPGATLTPRPIQGGADRPNLSITGVSLSRATFTNQERVTVTAGVVNRTERPLTDGTIALEVNGLPIASRSLSVDGGESASVTFEPFTLNARNMRGTVRLGDDALAIDNLFHFVVSPTEPVRLTLVTRGGDSALYVSRALAVGDAPRLEVTTREPNAVSDDDLGRSAVVVLNDVEVPVALGRRLARFVEQGGGLFVAVGARATWPAEVDLLPVSLGGTVDRTRGTAARVGGLDFGHPVFEPFRSPRSGDFSTAQVYGYRTLTIGPDATVLARFDAGTPALAERRVGTGRVLVWGTTLDRSWSDIPLSGAFVPFVHRSVRHLAAFVESQPWMTVGQVLDPAQVARAQRSQQPHQAVLTPSATRIPIDDDGPVVMELTEQGFYELRGEENRDIAVVASNIDPAEADLTPLDPQELVAAATGEPGGGVAGQPQAGVPLSPETQERTQRLWWFLLVAGVLLLGVDTLLSNRLTTRNA